MSVVNLPIHLTQILLLGDETAQQVIPWLSAPWVLIGAGIAWSAAWTQLIVLPFYAKGERLHQDYHANGRVNEAISAIEANRLIPALARIFQQLMDARDDKRAKPDFEALLNAVDFLPDLTIAQQSISATDKINWCYRTLRTTASKAWKWGLLHVFVSPALPTAYLLLAPLITWWVWVLAGIGLVWLVTLVLSLIGLFRFHSQLATFNTHLENAKES